MGSVPGRPSHNILHAFGSSSTLRVKTAEVSGLQARGEWLCWPDTSNLPVASTCPRCTDVPHWLLAAPVSPKPYLTPGLYSGRITLPNRGTRKLCAQHSPRAPPGNPRVQRKLVRGGIACRRGGQPSSKTSSIIRRF